MKKNNGIALIPLIVTITAVLVLSGVTYLLIGDGIEALGPTKETEKPGATKDPSERTIQPSDKKEGEVVDWEVYRDEELGYELNYPDSFTVTTTDCHVYTTKGQIKDERAVKFSSEEKGVYLFICRPDVWYKNLSWIRGEAIEVDGHKGYVDKFVIRGGKRAYYFLDQDTENSIFIDTFCSYPESDGEDGELKSKEELVDKIISTFNFLETGD